mgnify:CR=1 FL=1
MMNEETQHKAFRLLERLWLGGIAIGIAGVVYFLVMKDNDSALFFFGFFILSSLIYLMRRRQSRRHREYLEQRGKQK